MKVKKMFSFFHRTPEIHVDCFTFSHSAYENVPIVYANRSNPEWWRELPSQKSPLFGEKNGNNHMPVTEKWQTAKDCYGIIEFYKRGMSIRSWCDYSIKVKDGVYDYCWSGGLGADHHINQLGKGFPNHFNIKLLSPWKIREKTGIKFMWVGDEYGVHNQYFKVLPAIISYDISCATNINIMVPLFDHISEITIGTSLIHIIPLTEKKIIFKNHLISKTDYDSIDTNSLTQSFYGWRKMLKIRKQNKQIKKCPFGFGDK